MTSRTSSSVTEPFIGMGYVLLWTVLFAFQLTLMVLRFRDWWATATGIDHLESGLVLMCLILPCVQLWNVHRRLKADELGGDPQSKANSFALTKFLTSSMMSMLVWFFLLAIMLTNLFARALHSR